MEFIKKLNQAVDANSSLLCVGLDPDLEKVPKLVKSLNNPLFEFNKAIIDATANLVCCFKLNSAFYEAEGANGVEQLKLTCDYIRKNTTIPILLDFKRADIGNTNFAYAKFAFSYLQADAITLNPYLGGEALGPYFDYKDKGIIILIKTSNPGSAEFQNLKLNDKALYEIVAEKAAKEWNKNGNVMAMVGATYPKELARVRQIVGDMIILSPGIGAQGGDLKLAVQAGLNGDRGLIINASRSSIYPSSGDDFAVVAGAAAIKLRNEINLYRD
jgi:orotidine-5'-phosphate decarboxylase